MRILFLNPIGGVGGAERVLLAAAGGVKRVRPDATVRVVTFADGPLLAAAAAVGAETEVVPLPAALGGLGDSAGGRLGLAWRGLRAVPAGWRFAGRLKAAVRAFAPDLVHSNGIKTHLLSRLAVPKGVPVVWHLHDFYGTRRVAGKLLRRAKGRVRAAVAISRAVAADAEQVLPNVPVRVVPNAVDLAQFRPGPGDALPPVPPGTLRVGLVATYARWKGHLTLLDAAAKLKADAPGLAVMWYVVGGPIYHTAAQFTEAELRAAADARGVADRVTFVPFTPDPAAVYRSLDVVVHASAQPEPFGLTIAEAMACGRAVVVSAAGGAAELFTDGADALGVPPGDAAVLARAVRALADDTLRARLGVNARATAEARFDVADYGPRLAAVYDEVLRGATP
jgi:glycosyltransferase involved in cell wall biosynthesis